MLSLTLQTRAATSGWTASLATVGLGATQPLEHMFHFTRGSIELVPPHQACPATRTRAHRPASAVPVFAAPFRRLHRGRHEGAADRRGNAESVGEHDGGGEAGLRELHDRVRTGQVDSEPLVAGGGVETRPVRRCRA